MKPGQAYYFFSPPPARPMAHKRQEEKMVRGKSWTAIRRRVIQRDRYQCQICGDVTPIAYDGCLYVHHIIHRAAGGPDDLRNVITLCDLCHGVIHGYAGWFGVDKLALPERHHLFPPYLSQDRGPNLEDLTRVDLNRIVPSPHREGHRALGICLTSRASAAGDSPVGDIKR